MKAVNIYKESLDPAKQMVKSLLRATEDGLNSRLNRRLSLPKRYGCGIKLDVDGCRSVIITVETSIKYGCEI
jgi:hypothetical protein